MLPSKSTQKKKKSKSKKTRFYNSWLLETELATMERPPSAYAIRLLSLILYHSTGSGPGLWSVHKHRLHLVTEPPHLASLGLTWTELQSKPLAVRADGVKGTVTLFLLT